MKIYIKDQKGFGLFDILIAATILTFVILGIIPLFATGIRLLQSNSFRSIAQEIAATEMEKIKSLPYDSIGLINGNPPGIVNEESVVVRNGRNFSVKRRITWFDDPSDGKFPDDSDPRDMKYVEVKVSWTSFGNTFNFSLKSKIARNSKEPLPPGGHIVAFVKTYPDENPVENVKIELTAGPSAPRYDYSQEDGKVLFPAVINGNYTIKVTPPPGYIAYPTEKNITVDIGEAEYVDFYVTQAGSAVVRLIDPLGRLIDKNSWIKISHPLGIVIERQNSNGLFDLGYLIPGLWTFEFAKSSSYISTSGATFMLNPLEEKTVDIVLKPRAAANIHLTVKDLLTQQPIEGAAITLIDSNTSDTVTGQTNSSGIFEQQLYEGTFVLKITKDGYNSYEDNIAIDISVNNIFEVSLSRLTMYGSIRVRAEKESDGSPRNNIQIRVMGRSYNKTQSTGDYAPGETLFSNLNPGTYYVYRNSGNWWIGPVTVDLSAGEVEYVVFRW